MSSLDALERIQRIQEASTKSVEDAANSFSSLRRQVALNNDMPQIRQLFESGNYGGAISLLSKHNPDILQHPLLDRFKNDPNFQGQLHAAQKEGELAAQTLYGSNPRQLAELSGQKKTESMRPIRLDLPDGTKQLLNPVTYDVIKTINPYANKFAEGTEKGRPIETWTKSDHDFINKEIRAKYLQETNDVDKAFAALDQAKNILKSPADINKAAILATLINRMSGNVGAFTETERKNFETVGSLIPRIQQQISNFLSRGLTKEAQAEYDKLLNTVEDSLFTVKQRQLRNFTDVAENQFNLKRNDVTKVIDPIYNRRFETRQALKQIRLAAPKDRPALFKSLSPEIQAEVRKQLKKQ